MPVLFDIRSSASNYSVITQSDALEALAPQIRLGPVIADLYFAQKLESLEIPAIALKADEAIKSLDAAGDVIVRMLNGGVTRRSHLWAIGGGAIQDVAGFVASVYMRGIDWTYMPSTLLGMVDSCIGGKSSINVRGHKNIVGTFHTPKAVVIDASLTASLTDEQRVAGLVEAAKICYCRGADVFDRYLSLSPRVNATSDELAAIIGLSLRAKKWFVEIDEFDRAERLMLNLGHTFGHALEGASGYRLGHGVAVGVGVLCAYVLSHQLLRTEPGGAARLLEQHIRELLKGVPGLAEILHSFEVPRVLDRIKTDKKHERQNYCFVTFDWAGKTQLTRLPKSEGSDGAITFAVRQTRDSFAL